MESKIINDCVGKYHQKKAKKETKSNIDRPMMKRLRMMLCEGEKEKEKEKEKEGVIRSDEIILTKSSR